MSSVGGMLQLTRSPGLALALLRLAACARRGPAAPPGTRKRKNTFTFFCTVAIDSFSVTSIPCTEYCELFFFSRPEEEGWGYFGQFQRHMVGSGVNHLGGRRGWVGCGFM